MTEPQFGADSFVFLDYRCPKCRKRWGWHGAFKDRPQTGGLCARCRPKRPPERTRIVATHDNIDELFIGVMIPVHELYGMGQVPGWKCRACGWTVGSVGLPPAHDCPGEQKAK